MGRHYPRICDTFGGMTMSWMDNMTEEERKEWLEAGTIADEIWEARKRGECQPTLRESLLEWESNHRMEHW